jgi:hypothetical protein
MTRTRTIELSALNIAMHEPHSPEKYVDLFRRIENRRQVVRIGELHRAMIGEFYPANQSNPLEGFFGEIYKFVKIDPNEPWFNTQTHEKATDDETEKINIPAHLLPHLHKIPFFLNPNKHFLWFVKRDRNIRLGVDVAKRLFERLIADFVNKKLFPNVVITPLSDAAELERMLRIPSMKKIFIELKRPNSDDGVSEEERWQKRLSNQNAEKIEFRMSALAHDSICPDDETKTLARIAARNGKVIVSGYNADGTKIEQSTESYPLVEQVVLDENITTVNERLQYIAHQGR